MWHVRRHQASLVFVFAICHVPVGCWWWLVQNMRQYASHAGSRYVMIEVGASLALSSGFCCLLIVGTACAQDMIFPLTGYFLLCVLMLKYCWFTPREQENLGSGQQDPGVAAFVHLHINPTDSPVLEDRAGGTFRGQTGLSRAAIFNWCELLSDRAPWLFRHPSCILHVAASAGRSCRVASRSGTCSLGARVVLV
jgi:hypothetical protein